jgi:hypothetical protein
MSSKCLELTQQVVPTVYDVTPEPEYRQVLEVDVNNRMVGDGNFFAVRKTDRQTFHQRLVNISEYFNKAINCAVTERELRC